MKSGWIPFEGLHTLLHRSLQRSNDTMLRDERGTPYTITEMTVDLPLYTSCATDHKDVAGTLYVRFPHTHDIPEEDGQVQVPEGLPLSRIKLSLRPTLAINIHSGVASQPLEEQRNDD
ncbi:hypothetical protein [Paenibacillus thermotolerans]|uniref:hypothetical protein n=1 Tax=Paenibacillus thermotolerans TaxID=3027807 RepID=UPI002367D723|nr:MULTISPECIES: hypothetical protein [unclassified Paenibacillus]